MENKYKIVAVKISDELYFISKHEGSKYHNNFTNEIIGLEQLFDELLSYANNNIIYLEDILAVKDVNDNYIDYEQLYSILDSLIIVDKLINRKLLFLNNAYSIILV